MFPINHRSLREFPPPFCQMRATKSHTWENGVFELQVCRTDFHASFNLELVQLQCKNMEHSYQE